MRNQDGYSLVEVLTGIAVFSILALASTNLFFSTTVGSTKDTSIRQVKQSGDFALAQMEQTLRSAKDLAVNQEGVVCEQDMSSLSSVDLADEASSWAVENGTLKLNGEAVTADNLTVEGDRLHVNCSYDTGSNSYFITIRFGLSRNTINDDKQEESHFEQFQTSVSLRNR